MWNCPICKQRKQEGLVCKNCGFDRSLDLNTYCVIGKLTKKTKQVYVDNYSNSLKMVELKKEEKERKRQEKLKKERERYERQEKLRKEQEERKRQEKLRREKEERERQEKLRREKEERERQEKLRREQEERERQEKLKREKEEREYKERLSKIYEFQKILKLVKERREYQELLKKKEEECERQKRLKREQEAQEFQETLMLIGEELKRQGKLEQKKNENTLDPKTEELQKDIQYTSEYSTDHAVLEIIGQKQSDKEQKNLKAKEEISQNQKQVEKIVPETKEIYKKNSFNLTQEQIEEIKRQRKKIELKRKAAIACGILLACVVGITIVFFLLRQNTKQDSQQSDNRKHPEMIEYAEGEYSDQEFAIIDNESNIDFDNITYIMRAERQMLYLAGLEAGYTTESNAA